MPPARAEGTLPAILGCAQPSTRQKPPTCRQAIRQAGLKNIRLSIGHSTMIHPDDKPRYKQYDVTANTFASKNAVPDKTVLKRIGKERLKYWQPMRSLLEMGIRLSMSADAPTAPLDPYLQMEVAMLRKEPDQKTGLYPEKEAITIKQVIRAYTMGAAYQIRAEKFIGSLEVGKRADLVIVNQDLFKIDPSQVHNTKAVLTILNGNIVYRRDASDQR